MKKHNLLNDEIEEYKGHDWMLLLVGAATVVFFCFALYLIVSLIEVAWIL